MLVIPILDIVQIYYQDIIKFNGEMGKPYPLYVTFLSCYSQGHIFQMIYLCFLPLYLLVIVGEECIVDYITGYKNILICKMGKNKYILQKMKSAFIVSFTIVFVGLGLNLILSQIVFNGGTNTPFDAEPLKYNSFVMVKTFLFEISYYTSIDNEYSLHSYNGNICRRFGNDGSCVGNIYTRKKDGICVDLCNLVHTNFV